MNLSKVNEITGLNIKSLNRLSEGNNKLSKHILIFSLPYGLTCPNHYLCVDTCYDKKIRYPGAIMFRYQNLIMSLDHKELLYTLLENQINRRNPRYVRIHEGGDFYSFPYIKFWEEVVSRMKHVKFYAYTKVYDNVYPILGKYPNINIINSIINGKLNYGSIDYVKSLNVFVCPYHHHNLICGEDCKFCMTNGKEVAFIKH